jgi:xylan 1,4-beta-xylosidase
VQASSSAQVPLDVVMADGVRGESDVGVLATRYPDGGVRVLLWNYHDDDVPGPDARVRLEIKGMPANRDHWLLRVDGSHANAFNAWKAMGSPQSPNATQYAELEKASAISPEVPELVSRKGRTAIYDVVVPRQGVVLFSTAVPKFNLEVSMEVRSSTAN